MPVGTKGTVKSLHPDEVRALGADVVLANTYHLHFRPGEQVVEELGRVNEILDAKATPEEAAAFRQWILQAAQASADAAKEGGFMGIGATRVSEGEKAMIAKLGEVLGVESA